MRQGKGVGKETTQRTAAAGLQGKCCKQQCCRTLQVAAIFSNDNDKRWGPVSGAE